MAGEHLSSTTGDLHDNSAASTTEAPILLNFTTTSPASLSNLSEATTTPDIAKYIASRLGAQHLPLTTIVPISVVYAIIFVLGVLGNVSTICVILKNKYMHTPTNVYLANLAISDLLTHLVGMLVFSKSSRGQSADFPFDVLFVSIYGSVA